MEWGEAVEGLAGAVVESRVGADCGDLRRTGDFLASRILKTLNADMKAEKKKKVCILLAASCGYLRLQ